MIRDHLNYTANSTTLTDTITAVICWTLWIARWLLLFAGYGLTADSDPEAVLQLGHLSLFTLVWPLIMLSGQGDELLVLLFLVALLIAFKIAVRRLGRDRRPA